MAIEIGPIAKPQIWLIGNEIYDSGLSGGFSARVDHAKNEAVTTLKTIGGGITQFDEENILTFNNRVRVIITGQVGNRFSYFTKDNLLPGHLTYEGPEQSNDRDPGYTPVLGQYSETWFTINGKDPVRGKCYLYKYKDINDADTSTNPSAGTFTIDNYAELGFILGSSQTGSDLITLKAKTFYLGNESRIAIAKFKIARHEDNVLEIENGIPIGN